MKKIVLFLIIILSFSLTACNNKDINEVQINQENFEIFKEKDENIEKEDVIEQSVLNKVINPINKTKTSDKSDKIVAARFTTENFDLSQKVLFFDIFEKDIYKKEDIENIRLNDLIIVSGESILVNKINIEKSFIHLNGGFESGKSGLTFTVNDENTYKTVLTDDYSTYTKLGETVLKLSDELTIDDYFGGEPDNKGKHYDINSLSEYINGLEDWALSFNENNTLITIKDSKIINITRRWVP